MDELPTPPSRFRPDGPIVLAPPRIEWAADFAMEATALVAALGAMPVALHHIGSTAIPGLIAKPVIDILLEVPSLDVLDARSVRLEALGYEALGEFGLPGRRYFRKNAPDGARTHQVHAFARRSPEITRHLAFRDYLRAFPEVAAQYAALKRRLAGEHANDHGAYSHGKTAFIRVIESRASDWQRQD